VIVRKQVRKAHNHRKAQHIMSTQTSSRRADTPKPGQLSYLKALALQTGTTFTSPRTRRQASCEIDRLKNLKTTRGIHHEIPRDLEPAEQPYATEQKEGEIIGYGSSARRREQTPEDLAPTPAREPRPSEGEPFELGKYETRAGEKRGLYGIRVNGQPRIIDAAAEGRGRTYTVELEVCEQDGFAGVKGIVAAYIAQARELGRIPMAARRAAG
jgi:hypothetical protein